MHRPKIAPRKPQKMTIEKRGKSYRATAYNSGKRYRKTFKTKTQAIQWILAIQTAEKAESVEGRSKTFRDLVERYIDDILPTLKSGAKMTIALRMYSRFPIGDVPVQKLTKDHFDDLFRQRVENPVRHGRKPSESTLNHDKGTLSAVLDYGIKLHWITENPVKRFVLLKETFHRERTASQEEIQKLCDVVGWDRVSPPINQRQRIVSAFVFSTLTGMRHGEIAKLQRDWIMDRYIKLPATATKTAKARNVALSKKAKELLELVLPLGIPNVFGLKPDTPNDSTMFRNIRNKAGLGKVVDADGNVIREGLNFHDGRATFATWASSTRPDGAPHLDPMTLARQLGHSDVKMTMRYYRSTPEQIAEMLDIE